MARVKIENLKKSYSDFVALKNISLDIASGAFFTLLGPSGCGKTTLLRAIAGFHRQDSGSIQVDGESIGDKPAHLRDVGMVFQDYAVFPHLSVFDNVAFGLRQRKVSSAELKQRVGEILEIVQLAPLADRMPHQLSGGQQQRVGLARALVIRPKVLLMDEPLSNLDAKLRVELRRDIRALQQEFGITTIYVTHDQEEALAISDEVCVMYGGVAQQVASPWDIYSRAGNLFVASFVGSNNRLKGALANGRLAIGEQASERPFNLPDGPVIATIRPEKVRLGRDAGEDAFSLKGTVRHAMFIGRELEVSIATQDGVVDALVKPEARAVALKPGDPIEASLPVADLMLYDDAENGRLLA
ncbi:ABC transporter ATP-binding protein [Consotaella salsifontis]|uniref:Iron(III) transport system ATP-binding protein n=1 Tax=Consotaella salsifontis TaxID=1365950 RepID=A0A1T4PIT3_9HYPH|nr:ABC transporter ATP-binding protein [Consotaella salsifontis]SJZ91454.1 iron(III) transport system ATP-binding protein [Consotaella salsifontis]